MTDTQYFLRNAVLPDGSGGDIGIGHGRITEIAAAGGGDSQAPSVDLEGGLVLPGFTDGHMHLDKTLFGRPWLPHQAGPTRISRIETEKVTEKNLGFPTAERASNLIEICVGFGTSHIRTHIDVDTDIRLSRLEGMLEARERYRDRVDIEIVAFPQSGVANRPGTVEVLDEAIKMGADLVGGIDPLVIDRDPVGQLDGIFGVADKHGVGIDIHVHEPGLLGIHSIEGVCERTEALGMQGKVAVSHGFSLAMVPERQSDETAALMARCGVSLVTHGAGGADLPPIRRLRAAGVEVMGGNDDVRDTWSPYGSGDMLERAMLIGWRADFRTDVELMMAFDIVTAAAARVRGDTPWGIAVGAPADLCAVQAQCVPEAVAAHPARKLVLKKGRIVARDGAYLANIEDPAA